MPGTHNEVTPPAIRMPWLDGLRGLAVLMILHSHFLPKPRLGELGTPLAYFGRLTHLSFTGVDLFLVISGFLVGGILIDYRNTSHLRKNFYLRRLVRIVPLTFLFIGITWLLWKNSVFAESVLASSVDHLAWWSSFAMLPNWLLAFTQDWKSLGILSPLWSLGIEVQFYLLAPFIMQAFRRPEMAALVMVFIGAASRFLILAWEPTWSLSVHFLPFCRADALGAGILAACIVRDKTLLSTLHDHRFAWYALLTVCGLGMAVLTSMRTFPGNSLLAGPGYTVIAVFYMCLLLLVGTASGKTTQRLWSLRLLTDCGRYSLFIYLFQGLFAVAAGWLLHPLLTSRSSLHDWLVFIMVPTSLILAAPLSWKWFEAPVIRLGRRHEH